MKTNEEKITKIESDYYESKEIKGLPGETTVFKNLEERCEHDMQAETCKQQKVNVHRRVYKRDDFCT